MSIHESSASTSPLRPLDAARFAFPTVLCCLLLMTLHLAGCQSNKDSATSPGSRKISEAQAKARDEFDTGAGKPPTPATMYALSRVLAAQGNTTQSNSVLRNLIQRFPAYSPAYNALAEAYLSVDRTDDAVSVLTAGVVRSPKDPVLLNNLGMAYFLQSDYDSARANFERASRAEPGEAIYRSNHAAALGMLGRVVEAAEIYRKDLRPAEVHENINILTRAKRVSQAQERPATGPSASAVRLAPLPQTNDAEVAPASDQRSSLSIVP